ncbi:MAG: hypothetical protein A2W90_04355 [Bacteroidetes bacterium GWF2_42_66]|nr:MAG: hypothetical protein A2W89_21500 [Bacteroidetes bacterium GWE2_42_39]OFY41449.1 MAG: hypothetical protein A2W90_04355 [Bacteroidetes bacterium GWF2_42_66]
MQIYSGYSYGSPKTFCFQPERVAPGALIQGTTVPNEFKISITNYKKGQDTLLYSGLNSVIKAQWNTNGSLILSGATTLKEYQDAIREVFYNNTSKNPTEETKNITITIDDADYLPATEHFYQFVSQPGITWSAARDAAAAKTLYGFKGYLATITSKVENDFIWTKTKGTGWIGASDAEKEDDWKWVTGPENGTLFWRGRGANAGGGPVNGAYSNWNTGEPNNSNTEYYAHITFNVGIAGSWNDLSNTGNTNPTNTYHPQGYLIEYGGMEPASSLKLSDYAEIEIVNFKFSDKLDATICQFDTVTLNHESVGEFTWLPADGLSSANIANPVASPMQTTTYKVQARIGTCTLNEDFKVNVKPAPIVNIIGDEDICEGETAALEAVPASAGSNYSYSWSTGETNTAISIQKENWYKVKTDNGECTFQDSLFVDVHEYPVYSLDQSDTLVCGDIKGQLKITSTDQNVIWTTDNPDLAIAAPLQKSTQMNVPVYGDYRVFVDLTSPYGCKVSDTLNVGFHQVPTSPFNILEDKCYGYSLNVEYTGNATENALYNWMYIDTISGIGLKDVNISLGVNDKKSRYLRLYVLEDGCPSTITEEYIKVIPNMTVWADTTANCEPFTASFFNETTEIINTYEWNFGDGAISSEQNPVHIFNEDGSYDVSLKIVSDEGCENTAVLKDFITVHPIPTTELDLKPDSCYGDTLEINYVGTASEIARYYWDLSDMNPPEIVHDPGTIFGPVKISLTDKPTSKIGFYVISEYNCKSPEIEIPFKRKPWVWAEADKYEGCPILDVGFIINAKDAVDKLNYKWNFGDENWVAGDSEVNHLFSEPDSSFPVRTVALSETTGCSDTVQVMREIKVYPIPVVDFAPDEPEVSIVNPLITFTNLSQNAIQYFWDFGDGKGVSDLENPSYTYEQLGYFDVQLIAENELSCQDSAFHQVLVRFEKIFPPTAFSPNSVNPENQSFLLATDGVETEGYHVQIFNRWGQLIFECKNEHKAWDGRMKNGQPAPAGTYIWVLNYIDFLGEKHQQNGAVSLLY